MVVGVSTARRGGRARRRVEPGRVAREVRVRQTLAAIAPEPRWKKPHRRAGRAPPGLRRRERAVRAAGVGTRTCVGISSLCRCLAAYLRRVRKRAPMCARPELLGEASFFRAALPACAVVLATRAGSARAPVRRRSEPSLLIQAPPLLTPARGRAACHDVAAGSAGEDARRRGARAPFAVRAVERRRAPRRPPRRALVAGARGEEIDAPRRRRPRPGSPLPTPRPSRAARTTPQTATTAWSPPTVTFRASRSLPAPNPSPPAPARSNAHDPRR